MQIDILVETAWEIAAKVWEFVKWPAAGVVAIMVGWLLLLMVSELMVAWEKRANESSR